MEFKPADTAVNKYVKNPDPAIKCFVIFGTNEGMIADYTNQLAKAICPDLNDAFRVVTFLMDNLEKDMGQLYAEYNAQSLLGGRRVVIIKDGNNNLTAHLKEMFKNSSSDTLVIISSSSVNTKSSLTVYAKDNPEIGLISCYEDREASIYGFAKSYLEKSGVTIAADAMQLLCARLSSDRKASAGELEKLITYLDTRRNIVLNDIKTAISDTSSSSQEDLCYFTANGNSVKAIEAYRELLHEGEDAVGLTRNLTYHFFKLLNLVAGIEKGQSAESAIKTLRPPVMYFRKDDLVMQLKIWKRKDINSVLELLYKCERSCKTTNMPAEEILSYTILQIAGAAKRLSRC